jgi:hypothetical protein
LIELLNANDRDIVLNNKIYNKTMRRLASARRRCIKIVADDDCGGMVVTFIKGKKQK